MKKLTIMESVIRDCQTGNGGAMNDETPSKGGSGGALRIAYGNASILNSLISGNSTGQGNMPSRGGAGGGIEILGDVTLPYDPTNIELIGTTIVDNDAGDSVGGGLSVGSSGNLITLSLSNLTITGNRAMVVGGARLPGQLNSPVVELKNSIIAQNVAPTHTDVSNAPSAGAETNFIGGDPRLTPLGDFGGPTLSRLPLNDSPVIDAASAASLPLDVYDVDGDGDTAETIPFDQRGTGHPRIFGAAPDIGAVEQNADDRLLLPRISAPELTDSPGEVDVNVFDSAAAGTFSGILLDENGTPIGNFSAKLTSSGNLSGSLFFNDLSITDRFRTSFDDPSGEFLPVPLSKSGYELALSLTSTTGGENKFRIGGNLTAFGEPDRSISADRSGFHQKNNPAPFAGSFTALLPASSEAGTPHGDGYALVKVGTDGKVRCVGALGDSTKLSVSGIVSEDHEWRLFKTLYNTKPKGSIGGVIVFQPVDQISDFNGSLSWQKNADTRKKLYPAGFLITDQPIVGSTYAAPFPGEAILSPIVTENPNNATWGMGDGNVTAPKVKDLTWNGKNKVSASGLSNDESLKISATPRTGLVRGSYRNKSTDVKIAFAGVAFQKQNIIAGNFPGDAESGFFEIRPAGLGDLTAHDDTDTEIVEGDTIVRGDVGVDGGTDNARFKVTNQGTGNLQVHGVSSDHPEVFAIINGGPALLAPGESVYFWTRFAPPTEEVFTASVSISSDAGNLAFDVTATGVAGSASGASSDDNDSWNGTSPATSPLATTTGGDGNYDPALHGGTYSGYSYRAELPDHPITGFLTIKAGTRNTSVSGTVIIAGARESFRGVFDAAGQFDGLTNRGTAIAFATASVTNGAGGKKIVGTLGSGDAFELVRNTFHKKSNPATDLENSYTMLLPSSDERGANTPQGDGYGAVKIGLDGKTRAALVLGDGTRVSQSSFVSVDGEWLLYKELYRTKPKGLLAGRLFFRDEAGISDFDGELQWLKHEDPREKRFNRGFNLRQVALGSIYTPPARGARAFTALDASLGLFVFKSSDGDNRPPSPLRGAWDTNNRVTYTRENREKLTVKVNSKTGIVTGNYNDPVQKHRVTFGGAIFSKQELLSGHFIGIDQTGVIEIAADPGE